MNVEFSNIINTFKTNADLLGKIMNQVPPDRWLTSPGEDCNHPLWITGHIIGTRGNIIRFLGGE
jgi:hypothetical protein